MPYKDPVNEHVKRVVSSINRRFIAHTDLLGSTNAINSKNPSVEPQGSSLLGQGRTIGGSKGCASWSAGAATKHYEKSDEPSERSGGAILGLQDGTLAGDRSKPKYSQTSYKAPETDNTGKFGALGDAFASRLDAKPLGPVAANSRSGYAHKDDSPLESQDLAYAQQHGLSGGMSRNVPISKHQQEKKNREIEKYKTLQASKTPEEWAEIRKQEQQAKIDAFNSMSDEEKQAYNDNYYRTHPERHTGNWVKPPTKQNSFWDDFGDTFKSVGSFAKPLVGLIPGVGPMAQQAMTQAGMGHPTGHGSRECTCPRLKSGKAPKRCKCGARLQGEGFFDDVWSGIKSVGSIAKPFVGLIPGYGPAAQMAMGMAGMGAPSECTCPRLKSGKAPKRCKCGYLTGKGMIGGSGFAAGTHMDVGSGETFGISSHGPTRGAGRRKGGAVLGLVKAPVAGPLDHSPPAYGNKKAGPKATSKKDLDRPTTKADMPSSTLSGMGKKSARAEIVKKVMKERGVKLMEASSIVKKEGLYKP